MNVNDKLKRLRELKELHRMYKDEIEAVQPQIDLLNRELCDYFASQGMQSVKLDGSTFFLRINRFASQTDRQGVRRYMQAEGHPELLSVNPQTFQAFVRERIDAWEENTERVFDPHDPRCIEAAIGELADMVRLYEKPEIAVRKVS